MLFQLIYNAPLIILCAFWLLFRREEEGKRLRLSRALLDVAVVSIALARFYGSSIPPSGHALFLTHSLLTVGNRFYRLAALIMLAATIGLKISWSDYTSWSYGLALGVISGALWLRAGGRSRAPSCSEEDLGD